MSRAHGFSARGHAHPVERDVSALAEAVPQPDELLERHARERHDTLTKPARSLGHLEDLGIRLATITGRCPPSAPARPQVLLAAGDHGVLAQGVSHWPREATAAMIRTFCDGGAAVNAIAREVAADITVLDVGVATPLTPHPRLRSAKIRAGTADLSREPAMSREEAGRAVLAGAETARELAAAGCDLLITGDMGIGNTTPAACLIATFTGREPGEVTGSGAGIDDAGWHRKVRVVEAALALHRPDPTDPVGVLAAVGGLEHAALAGAILAAAASRVPVVLDGVNTNAAALCACALAPETRGSLIAGHVSLEPGSGAALAHLGLRPVLDLDLRLGEGTGALLAVPILRAAATVLGEMATFNETGIGG